MSTRFAWSCLSVLVVGIGWARPSRGDAPAQTCAAYQSLVTCSASDVGKACAGGGQCNSLFCRSDAGMTIYKCVLGSDAGPATDSTAQNGGCDIVARTTGPGAIAFGLLLIGSAMLLIDRRRKRVAGVSFRAGPVSQDIPSLNDTNPSRAKRPKSVS